MLSGLLLLLFLFMSWFLQCFYVGIGILIVMLLFFCLLCYVVVLLWGEAFLLTVGAFWLELELLYLQSIEMLMRRTLPL